MQREATGSHGKPWEATGRRLTAIRSKQQTNGKQGSGFCTGRAGPKNAGRRASGPDDPDKLHPATPRHTGSISRPRSFARTHARTHATQTQVQSKSISRKGVLKRRTYYPQPDIFIYIVIYLFFLRRVGGGVEDRATRVCADACQELLSQSCLLANADGLSCSPVSQRCGAPVWGGA